MMVVLKMVIQNIGAQQNCKKESTFLVLEIGNFVMKAAQTAHNELPSHAYLLNLLNRADIYGTHLNEGCYGMFTPF